METSANVKAMAHHAGARTSRCCTFRIGCAQIEQSVFWSDSIVLSRHAPCTQALHAHAHRSAVSP